MDRKLAAILAADVVGYSALMERDEKGTFARLKSHRTELFEPEIEKHHGRVFKLMGDGLLAEFGSVVDAVECAVTLQQEMAKRDAGAPADARITVRIGINLGDVIVEGADRYGESVNIASRLEQLAEPGGICVSQTVIDHLGNKLPIDIEAMGEHRLKNITKAVQAYRVKFDGRQAAPPIAALPKGPRRVRFATAAIVMFLIFLGALVWFRPWMSAPRSASVPGPAASDTRPSLVVLPFDSLSDNKDQAYLAEGITEDLTTALARIPGLFVVSRNSAFTYKGKPVAPAQISKELGVRYILEGSIRRSGDDMRINAQLIDATTGGHMWAERFDGAWSDVFTLQDKVVASVAAALKLQLIAGPRMAEAPGGTSNPAAYNLYLQGYQLSYPKFPGEVAAFYRQATALDSNFGQAWSELAWLYWLSIGNEEAEKAIGLGSHDEGVRALKQLLKEAAKHPSSTYYALTSDILLWTHKYDEAIQAAERSIALDPSDFWAYDQMSRVLAYDGRCPDAKAYLDAAWRVDPQPLLSRYLTSGIVEFCLGLLDDVVASLNKVDSQELNESNKLQRLFLLVAAHAELGHADGVASAKAELDAFTDINGLRASGETPFKTGPMLDRLLAGLSKAGLPDLPFGYRWNSSDRLTGVEINALVFGHEIRGRHLQANALYSRSTAADGTVQKTIGSSTDTGTSRLVGDFLCTAWDSGAGEETCAVIFRNPSGNHERQNEYVFVTSRESLEFSVVK
jgi:TolB-like protein/class 3 adenylate cyclase